MKREKEVALGRSGGRQSRKDQQCQHSFIKNELSIQEIVKM